jgi:ribonucleoside-diphosphate reductase alpha chain
MQTSLLSALQIMLKALWIFQQFGAIMSDTLNELKATGEAPEWMNDEGYRTLCSGYMLPKETPKEMYSRVAKATASYYPDSKKWEEKFFNVMWKNWLCPASPVLSNMGTNRGLPISCNTIHVGDSVDSIFMKNHELAVLSKNGAGVGIYFGDIRGRGARINGNGVSEGTVPWAKVFDTTTVSVNQGSTRRGASAIYLPIEHLDIKEFINIRRPTGDVNRRCLNINHGICVSDEWMNDMLDGNKEKRTLWEEILRARFETGEPYLFFTDSVNKHNPKCYVDNNLQVKSSNICTEITLFTDPDHSFVCCLSSLNLVRWEEWKDTDTVNITVRFLDAVLSEYINKTENMKGMDASRRSAIKGRAIGIGVLGFHTLLQEKMLPFDSFDTMQLNAQIFRSIHAKANEETKILARELGEPEWCTDHERRNTHLIAIAPTVSNSTISGGYSAGVEPLTANVFSQKSAKGTFIRKNRTLETLLESKEQNTPETWKSINEQNGSVQHLKCLSALEKEVFLTARELNQHIIVKLAVQRQRWVDQAQSINLFFAQNSSPKYIHDVHLSAWKSGLKTLYYLRSDGVIKSDLASRSENECKACES